MNFKKITTLLLTGVIALTPMTVHADDISSVKTEIETLKTSLNDVTKQEEDINSKLDSKNEEITTLTTELNEKQEVVSSLSDSIKLRNSYLDELNENTDYKDLISNSKTHSNILDKMSKINSLIDSDKEELKKDNKELKELEENKETLETEKNELETTKTEITNKKTEIETQINQKQAVVDQYNKEQQQKQQTSTSSSTQTTNSNWNGSKLTRSSGVNYGPTGKETYYNLNMSGVVSIMRSMGNNDQYWIRADGCKMLGNYIMVAANLSVFPRGSLVPTSLGTGIVCDTGSFAYGNPTQLDIATNW